MSNIIPERKDKVLAIVEVNNNLMKLYHENVFPGKEAI